MSPKRTYYIMLGFVCLLVFGTIFSIYLGDKNLKQHSSRLVDLKLENRVLDEQQISLTQATKDIEKYKELQQIAKSIVPQDKDQAAAVREIVKIANESGVKLSTINFPASTLGQPVPKTTPTDDNTAQPKSTTPPVTQVKPVEGINGVYVMEINIQQDPNSPVTFDRLTSFLGRLEQNRRTAQVTNVAVQPNPQNRNLLTFNLVVNIYIKP